MLKNAKEKMEATHFFIQQRRQHFFQLLTIILLCFNTVSAQTKLQTKVFTASQPGFCVNSTLVYGQKDAILIDAQFTLTDARHLVDTIRKTGRNLTTVYVTHFHPDHYFGLVEIKRAFPNAKMVALPRTVKEIRETWEAKVKQWKPNYGDKIPDEPITPDELQDTKLLLEDNTLEIHGEVQGDCENNSFVWIPSIKTVICGDIVYSGVYPWTLETTANQRKAWIETIDKIKTFNPEVVVAGHKNPVLKNDPSSLDFSKNYLQYYDEALSSSKNSEEFQSKIKTRFPNLILDIILKLAADASFPEKKK